MYRVFQVSEAFQPRSQGKFVFYSTNNSSAGLAHLRPAAREALDVKRTEQASIKEATSVAAQIQELQRKRKEHLAAAERLRAQVAEVSGQEGVDALRSPDSSMPALAGRTEAELIEGLQLRRKSEAASRPSALPSRSQHDPFSDLPALPQPSVGRHQTSHLIDLHSNSLVEAGPETPTST